MRLVPFLLFLGLTSALVGGLIGASQDSAAAGAAAGILTCVLLAASTALVAALARQRGVRTFHLAIRGLAILNIAALAASIALLVVTNGTVQIVSIVSAGISAVILLFIIKRSGPLQDA